MRTLVFLLEEPSAKAMLQGLLPRLLPDGIELRFLVFEGKQDLEKQLGKRLHGWRSPDSAFLILRDQDAGSCEPIKDRLASICRDSGHPEAVVRIACRELESWYFGDLTAVEAGLGRTGLAQLSAKAKYRVPDEIVNPSDELERLTGGEYQKVAGSRAIGPHLDPARNTSRSFQVFLAGLQRLI
jgi:hypothetical protein